MEIMLYPKISIIASHNGCATCTNVGYYAPKEVTTTEGQALTWVLGAVGSVDERMVGWLMPTKDYDNNKLNPLF